MGKLRLDQLLFDRGLAESREKAKALIMAGSVYVGGQKQTKPGTAVPEDADEYRVDCPGCGQTLDLTEIQPE